jgi:Flp pilus assembly protein TadB
VTRHRIGTAGRCWWALVGSVSVGQIVGGPLTALSAAVLAGGLIGVHRGRVRRRCQAQRSGAWQAALGRCAAELQAGADLPSALLAGAGADANDQEGLDRAGPCARLRAAGAAAQAGGEPWIWLGEVQDPTGRALGACLALAARLGAAPAPLLVRLAAVEAAQELQRREVEVALATAMATGRLLAALPLAGVGLAAALGTSAPRFLFGSLPGQLSLLLAAILESTGLLWLERLQPGGQR